MATSIYIPEGYAQFTLKFVNIDSPHTCATTCGIRPNPLSDFNANDCATAVRGAFCSVPGAVFSPANMLIGWKVDQVSVYYRNGDGDLLYGENNVDSNGSKSGAAVPMNSAVKVEKLTGIRGRKYRGRFYMPPTYALEANVDSAGKLGSGDVSGIQSGMTAAYNSLTTDGYQPVLLHSWAGIPAPLPIGPTTITSFVVKEYLGTQRRRYKR